MICEICGKKPMFTKNVAHQRLYVTKRTNRMIKPNLHSTTIIEKGVKKHITACTRCIRTMRKANLPRH